MKRSFLLILAFLFTTHSLAANIVTLSTSDPANEVMATSMWSDASGGFRIESSVTENSGLYTYSYFITNDAQWYLAEEIDTFMIGIGDQDAVIGDIIKDMALTTNASSIGLALNNLDLSTYGMAGSLYGLNFDVNSGLDYLYMEFQSYLQPMMGDFFAVGGSGSYAFNAALNGGSGELFVPDSAVNVPEPSTYFLLGTMLFAVMLMRRRREEARRARASKV